MVAGESSVIVPDDLAGDGAWLRLAIGVVVAVLLHGGIAWVWSAGMTPTPMARPPLLLDVVMTPPRLPQTAPQSSPQTAPQSSPPMPTPPALPAAAHPRPAPATPAVRKVAAAPAAVPVAPAGPASAVAADTAADADARAETAAGGDGRGPASVATPAPAPVRRAARIDAAISCRLPEYPPAARRAGETGTVRLRFLVDVDGQVAETVVDGSSGFARLDAAARDALSLCHFQPGTIDGRPERAWARLDYVWKLR